MPRVGHPLFLAALFTATIASPVARADIYTWTDSSGKVTISNLPPPDGVRVTHVAHENPVPPAVREEAAREAARRAELQALNDRLRQLEDEVELARRQPPPAMDYRAAMAPPPYAYPNEGAPQPPEYGAIAAPPAGYGCDVTWSNCGYGWAGVYPASVVVLRDPRFRRFHSDHGHPGRHPSPHHPPRAAPISAGGPFPGARPPGGTARSDARGSVTVTAARRR